MVIDGSRRDRTPPSLRVVALDRTCAGSPGHGLPPGSLGGAGAAWRRRRHGWQRRYLAGLTAADVLALLAATGACFVARPGHAASVDLLGWPLTFAALAAVMIPAWFVALATGGGFQPQRVGAAGADYRACLLAALGLAAVVAVLSYGADAPSSRSLFLVFFPTLVALELCGRAVARRLLVVARRRGRALNRLVLAGERGAVDRLARHLAREVAHGYRIVASVTRRPMAGEAELDDQRRGLYDGEGDIVATAEALEADSVAIAGEWGEDWQELRQVAWELEARGIDLLIVPDAVDFAGPRIRVAPLGGLPILHIDASRLGRLAGRCTWWFQWAAGLLLALAMLPIVCVLAIVVLVSSGRPVFYGQQRIGYNGRPFRMLKFRTMVPDAERMLGALAAANEHHGVLFKIRDDPRVTPAGRFLRKYSLDELPQLLNVIRGEMVLVGPRPCLPGERERFGTSNVLGLAAHRRFHAKPGLTGLWQVSGRSNLSWEEAVQLDLWYVENWSPWLDCVILWRTIGVVLGGGGC